jgi:hypothetical protein
MGGFVLLLTQIRYDHRMILQKQAIAWTPIVFSILMIVSCVLGLCLWNRGGRSALSIGFLIAIAVGLLGLWYHSDGHPIRETTHDLSAWVRKIPDEDRPPTLAPLAFVGFGLLGWCACAKRFRSKEEQEEG